MSLTRTEIDAQQSDGSAVVDMTGSGSLDTVVSADSDGAVYWYENDAGWTQHTISTGLNEVEEVAVADIDGDGQTEVWILDQGNEDITVAKADSSDPTGSWSTTVITTTVHAPNNMLVDDISGDGDANDVFYSAEGEFDSTGGIWWLEYTGGGVLNSANWSKHQAIQEDGAWGIARQRVDISGDGNADDLVFGARTARNASAAGGVWYLEPPADPTNTWTQTAIATDTPYLHVDVGDLTGNGSVTDVVAGRFDDATGLVWFDGSNSWAQSTIESSGKFYNARAHDFTGGAWDIISVKRIAGGSDTVIQFFEENSGSFDLATEENYEKSDDNMPIADLDGDGNDEILTTSEAGSLSYWDVDTNP